LRAQRRQPGPCWRSREQKQGRTIWYAYSFFSFDIFQVYNIEPVLRGKEQHVNVLLRIKKIPKWGLEDESKFVVKL
jgi:hypothetical protein